jgi:hypothetical protein
MRPDVAYALGAAVAFAVFASAILGITALKFKRIGAREHWTDRYEHGHKFDLHSQQCSCGLDHRDYLAQSYGQDRVIRCPHHTTQDQETK